MCKHVGLKEKYCENCMLESCSERCTVIGQLQARLDLIWEELPGERDRMLGAESLYPISGIEILATVNSNKGLQEAVLDLYDHIERLKEKHPTLKLGANCDGFYLYKVKG